MKRLYAINSNVANWNPDYIGNVGFVLTEDLETDMRRFALNVINKEKYPVDNTDSGVFSSDKNFMQRILFSNGIATFYTGDESAFFFVGCGGISWKDAVFTAVEIQPTCFENIEKVEVSCTFAI